MSKKIKLQIMQSGSKVSIHMKYATDQKTERYYFSVVFIICCINMLASLTTNKEFPTSQSKTETSVYYVTDYEDGEIIEAILDCIEDFTNERADIFDVDIRKEQTNVKE